MCHVRGPLRNKMATLVVISSRSDSQARSQVVCWGGGGGGVAKQVISGLNQWCSQDDTCSIARTVCVWF